jgi:hypothetical protein
MQTIDPKWINKLIKVHDKFSRSIPLNSKSTRCTQSIFIDRYFKWLGNRSFKLNINGVIHYATFLEMKNTDGTVKSYGCRKGLTYGHYDFILRFLNERSELKDLKLHINDIYDIQYEEISNEKFFEILKLF